MVNSTFVLVSLFLGCDLCKGVCCVHKYSCEPPLLDPLVAL
jgi:hypothetical protein